MPLTWVPIELNGDRTCPEPARPETGNTGRKPDQDVSRRDGWRDGSARAWRARLASRLLAVVAISTLFAGKLHAADYLWDGADSNFSNASNWLPNGIPSVNDTAIFGAGGTTTIDVSTATAFGGWLFKAGGPDYQISISASGWPTFYGAGLQMEPGAGRISIVHFEAFFSALQFAGYSSAGNVFLTNQATTTFFENASAAQATIENQATLEFLDDSTADRATITNTTTGSLNFFERSRAGSANITNDGAMGFTQVSDADHATITNNDSLSFFSASTAGHATLINNANLGFYSNSSPGQATFINNAGAIIDFSGSTGTAGDGKLTAGSIAGPGSFYLGSRQLTVGSNNLSTEVNGLISDGGIWGGGGTGGSLVKVGSGTLTLSGTNAYTGATTVSGGTLLVNGSIALSSLTTVEAGTTLGGDGTVGHTFIDGGMLSPGNSIGTLTVQGNLVLTAASTYMVEVSPASADFTHVTGTATLGGAMVSAHFAPGSYVEKRYTILRADGGIGGTFSGPANTNLPQNFKSALAYDGSNVYLDLTLDYTPPPAPGPTPPGYGSGLNGNQQNVANTLVNYFNATGGIPLTFGALDSSGLSHASGETATGALQAAFDAQSHFLTTMTDPFATEQAAAGSASPSQAMGYAENTPRGRTIHDAYAVLMTKAPPASRFEQRWRVFGAAYGGSAQIGGNASLGSHDLTSRVYGGMGAAAYKLSSDTSLGFALGGGGTSFSLSEGLGSGRSDLFQAGVFAHHDFAGAGYLTGAFAYGWHDVTTDRVAPTGERLRGAYKAHVLSGRIEAGWRLETMFAGITPYAAAQAINYRMPSYLEQGNGAIDSFVLGYAGRNVTATRSELGLRFDRSTVLNDTLLTLRGRAAWAHNFDRERWLAAAFQALPGTGFIVNGAAQAADAVLISAGAEVGWRNGLSLAASFEGEFSNTTTSYAGKGVIRYAW